MLVAIIGGGAAGLASARHVSAEGIECEVLEMTSELGGTWVYTDDVDKDSEGFPVYSAMYKNLRINVAKEVMGFPDFPVPDQEISYLTQPEVLEFLKLYADHFKLRDLIKFNRLVTEIRPLDEKWQVTSMDKLTKEETVSVYDAVMICVGYCNEPILPTLQGQEKFEGKIYHSQQFRSPEPFTNQRVLIIGGGPSGLDLVCHIKPVAQHVVLSHHSEKIVHMKWGPNVTCKPDVLQVLDGETVEFVDNSCGKFDAIVFCTGYKYSYPFLHETCGVTVEGDYAVQPLYKQIINIERPTMCFIGIPIYVCAFLVFDLQARFFCQYLTDRKTLPSAEEMREDTKKKQQSLWAKGYPKKLVHFLGPEQEDYFNDVATTAEITPIPPVYPRLWNEAVERLFNDFLNFRKDNYKIIDNENFVRIN